MSNYVFVILGALALVAVLLGGSVVPGFEPLVPWWFPLGAAVIAAVFATCYFFLEGLKRHRSVLFRGLMFFSSFVFAYEFYILVIIFWKGVMSG